MWINLNKIKIVAHLTRHYAYEVSDFQEIFIIIKAKIIANNPKQLHETLDYDKLEKNIIKFIKSQQFKLIEEIANQIADIVLIEKIVIEVKVEVGKLNIMSVDSATVEISKNKNIVVLALGSNKGDKILNLKNGVQNLKKITDIIDISSVYESKALLIENSPTEWNVPFFNIVLKGYTNFSPIEILTECQKIEIDRHQEKWAPRGLDIDIIFYNNITMVTPNLVIPHTEYQKRDFVLVPLTEINKDIIFNKPHNLKLVYDKSIWNS